MLIAPRWKHLAFTCRSGFGSGDFNHIRHTKPPQLADSPCAFILVGEPPADKLVIISTRRVSKNRYALRDASLDEVRRFERASAARSKRYDNDVGWRDRVADDERPSCGSQNRLPNGGKSSDWSCGCSDQD
jgi:hypothetical protein